MTEGAEALLEGEVDFGKAILRDYINATMGFGPLAEATGWQPKGLMRALGPSGNSTAKNLMAITGYSQRERGLSCQVHASWTIFMILTSGKPTMPLLSVIESVPLSFFFQNSKT